MSLGCLILGLLVGWMLPRDWLQFSEPVAAALVHERKKDEVPTSPVARARPPKKKAPKRATPVRNPDKATNAAPKAQEQAERPTVTDEQIQALRPCIVSDDYNKSTFLVEVRAAPKGRALQVRLLGNEFLQPEESACLADTVRRWSFPPLGAKRLLLRIEL